MLGHDGLVGLGFIAEGGYDQARREVLSAWLSMAAYDDKPGEAARQELTRRGWDIDNRIQKDNKSETKFRLAHKGQETLVAVTGTESLADVKSDLNLHAVPYKEGEASQSQVHAGFPTIRRPSSIHLTRGRR